jgi:ribose transport system substrate-binding protein
MRFTPHTWRRRRAGALGVLLACAALAVAACGGDDNGGGSSSGSSSSSSASSGGKNYKMTLIAGVKGDEFYITMNCGARAEAKKLGVTLNFQGPDKFAPDQQTPIVNAVAAKKPDAVLVAPTDTKAMFAPIKQMADNGSKVVLVDTTLEQPDLAVSQIASDNEGGGKQAAQTLGKLIGGKGKVFVVNVKPGISTTDARGKGFQEGAKAAGLTYVGQQFDDDDPAKAAAIVKSILAKNPDLKGIFATNLFSAEGAATGIREAGKQNQVKIVGFDAGPKQVEDLKSGVVQALIAQKPADIGAQGVQQAYAALTGKATKKQIGTGFVSLTKDNLAENSGAAYKASC